MIARVTVAYVLPACYKLEVGIDREAKASGGDREVGKDQLAFGRHLRSKLRRDGEGEGHGGGC